MRDKKAKYVQLSEATAATGLRIAAPELEGALARWLAEKAHKPEDVGSSDWLDYEQQKHQKLLAA